MIIKVSCFFSQLKEINQSKTDHQTNHRFKMFNRIFTAKKFKIRHLVRN